MAYDLNKEIDNLFEILEDFDLNGQATEDVFSIIIHHINEELNLLRSECDEERYCNITLRLL